MAKSPRWKVYAGSHYVAACKFAEDAAAVAINHERPTIRDGHRRIVWQPGDTADPAESIDAVAQHVVNGPAAKERVE